MRWRASYPPMLTLRPNAQRLSTFRGVAGISDLRHAVEDSGYSVEGIVGDDADDAATPKDVSILRTKVIFSLVVAGVIMTMMAISSVADALPFRLNFLLLAMAVPVQFWAGKQFYKGAWGALKHRTSNMNTLIAVGTSVAFLYSVAVTFFQDSSFFAGNETGTYFDTSTAIIGLVLLGKYMEARAKSRASNAIKALMGPPGEDREDRARRGRSRYIDRRPGSRRHRGREARRKDTG